MSLRVASQLASRTPDATVFTGLFLREEIAAYHREHDLPDYNGHVGIRELCDSTGRQGEDDLPNSSQTGTGPILDVG